MILEKAVQRLSWRFGKFKTFNVNKEDIDALNSIFEWITLQKEINLLNHDLFAKLYIMQLNKNLRDFDTTIFNDIPQKELSRVLSLPLESFYQSFYNDLHHNQLKKLKLDDGFTIEDVKPKFTYEIVKDKLIHMVTEAVNKFS